MTEKEFDNLKPGDELVSAAHGKCVWIGQCPINDKIYGWWQSEGTNSTNEDYKDYILQHFTLPLKEKWVVQFMWEKFDSKEEAEEYIEKRMRPTFNFKPVKIIED